MSTPTGVKVWKGHDPTGPTPFTLLQTRKTAPCFARFTRARAFGLSRVLLDTSHPAGPRSRAFPSHRQVVSFFSFMPCGCLRAYTHAHGTENTLPNGLKGSLCLKRGHLNVGHDRPQ